jgi:hypothetical protein
MKSVPPPEKIQLEKPLQAGGMAQLGGPIQGECQLHVPGLFRPQRAIVVEHCHALTLGNEVRRVRIAHRRDEFHDRALRGRLAPASQPIGVHRPLLHRSPSPTIRPNAGAGLTPIG